VASGDKCRKGYFEDLILYCGIRFGGCLRMVSGLIEMRVIDCLAGSTTKLGDTMRDRQLCMVAYLFE
jgi:hypothetical protein